MSQINVNNITMYYESQGQGEPIVFVSGFSSDHTGWVEVAKQLADSHQVILFDNRGAGQTTVPLKPFTIEQMAADVAALCAALSIEKAHFVGVSMGGFILQTLAVKYPDLVKSLIISNSTMNARCAFHVYVAAQLKLLKANAPLAALVHASSAWAFSYRFLSQPGMLDQLIQLIVTNPYPMTIQGYEGQYAALDIFDSSDWVGTIKAPTLVFGGDQDLIFSEASVKLLAEKIPHAKYFCFKECGHLPFIEYPIQFADLVRRFVVGK